MNLILKINAANSSEIMITGDDDEEEDALVAFDGCAATTTQ